MPSTFVTLRDKLEHMLAVLFGYVEPVGEQVLAQTSQDLVKAELTGTVHGSDDMINVVKQSLNDQLPALKNTALHAAAALITDHAAQVAAGNL